MRYLVKFIILFLMMAASGYGQKSVARKPFHCINCWCICTLLIWYTKLHAKWNLPHGHIKLLNGDVKLNGLYYVDYYSYGGSGGYNSGNSYGGSGGGQAQSYGSQDSYGEFYSYTYNTYYWAVLLMWLRLKDLIFLSLHACYIIERCEKIYEYIQRWDMRII